MGKASWRAMGHIDFESLLSCVKATYLSRIATGEPRGTVNRKASGGGPAQVWHVPMPFVAACAALALSTATSALAQGVAATGVGSQFELTFWQSVESGSDPALYEAYLAQYPTGTFATVARVKLAKLRQLAAPVTPAPVPAPAQQPVLPTPPAQAQIVPAAVVTAVTPPAPVPPLHLPPNLLRRPPSSSSSLPEPRARHRCPRRTSLRFRSPIRIRHPM